MFKDLIEKPYKATKALLTSHIVIECDRIPYHFHNVPLKKVFNWIRVETSILRKPEQPWGWPTHLQIEPANICNLRCSLCPVTDGMNRPAGRMDFQIFKKLIDADCIADSNWINEILKAHQSSHLAIGGAIANGNPESYVGWAAYLCEFSQWMPDSHTKYLIYGRNYECGTQ